MADTTESNPDDSCTENLKKYIQTKKGSILAAEMLLNLLFFSCHASSLYGFYLALPISEMIFCIVFFVIFMMDFNKKTRGINWVWADFFRAIVAAIIYIIISILVLSVSSVFPVLIVAGVLGLLAGLLYGYDTFTIFQQLQSTMQH